MPAVVRIRNDHGTMLIDDRAPVLSLREKKLVPMNLQPSGYYFGQLDLPGYQFPLVAIECGENCWLQAISTSGSWMTFRTNVSAPVTAYCFDVIVPAGASNGLVFNVRNEEGEVMFDIGCRPARAIVSTTSLVNEPIPSGKNYAVCMNSVRWALRFSLLNDPPRRIVERSYAPMANTAGGTATFNPDSMYASLTYASSDPLPPDRISSPIAIGFILDVTGY